MIVRFPCKETLYRRNYISTITKHTLKGHKKNNSFTNLICPAELLGVSINYVLLRLFVA